MTKELKIETVTILQKEKVRKKKNTSKVKQESHKVHRKQFKSRL